MINNTIKILAIGFVFSYLGITQTAVAEKIIQLPDGQKIDQARVISLGGDTTEIIYALQAEQQLVAVDTTSYWPEAAQQLPQVGYLRALSAEGILSLSPSLILMSNEAGPPAIIEQLQAVDIPIIKIPADKTLEGILAKIQTIATAIKVPEKGKKLADRVQNDFVQLKKLLSQTTSRPRVVFLLSAAKGSLLAAGQHTAADAMIQLSGGENVFTDYSGYKPVNSEVLIAAAPDFLLLPDRVLTSLGGLDKVMNIPGIALTPAGIYKQIVVMDTLYLLGFGPRTGQAAIELTQQLHPDLRGTRK